MTTASDPIILSPGEGSWLWWLGHPLRYLAAGRQTDQTYTLSTGSAPTGFGPPPYRHDAHEGFFVLAGEVTFTAGRDTVVVPEGGFINIAGGTPHYLRNMGAQEAELLVVTAPAGFERFQQEAGQAISGPRERLGVPTEEDFERMRRAAPRYGIDLDPPLELFQQPGRYHACQPGEGPSLAVVGDVYTFLAVGEDTGGSYAIWEAFVPPGGGPPPHIHSREEEGFFILEGEVTFGVNGRQVTGGPGTFAHLPRGSLHYFRNEGGTPARMLILVAPAGFEQMFWRVGRPWADPAVAPPPPSQEEIERLLAIAPEYGLEIPPPAG